MHHKSVLFFHNLIVMTWFQHPKYSRVLKHLNLSSVSSNKAAELEMITFDKTDGEDIGDNILIKKANKLIEMERRLKSGEKLKPSDWSSPTKEEMHKDAKVNAMFLKIPKWKTNMSTVIGHPKWRFAVLLLLYGASIPLNEKQTWRKV